MSSKLSRAQAVDMVRRWSVGSTRISGTIQAGNVVVRFIGCYVSEVSDRHFRIRQAVSPDEASQVTGEIIIDLGTVEDYELTVQEITAHPVTTVTMLQLHSAGYITCAIAEHNRDAAIPDYKM
jgi:hypothetical protein